MQRCLVKFSEYMHAWLYDERGYYVHHNEIGKEGDFYTAVSSSMFFGGSIAKRILQTIEEGFLSESSSIIEIGAHKGYLLADIVQFIFTLKPHLLKKLRFVIVEPFDANQKAQREYFEASFGDAIELTHVRSLEELDCESAFVVANEIFDAFTCEVIRDGEMLFMDQHIPRFEKIDAQTALIAKKYGITKGEVALGYETFAAQMCAHISKFEFVTFDYGDRASRGDFSLRVYASHQVYPFFALTHFVKDEELKITDVSLEDLFAKSDITYDVNFDHLIGVFEDAGASLHVYCSQMKALVSFGLIELLDMMQKNSTQEQYTSQVNRIKTLIDPAFMGERFKMVSFRKGK